MIVKVCGMREADNIRAVEQVLSSIKGGAAALLPPCPPCPQKRGYEAWMGFIFYPHSPRFVQERPAYLPDMPRVGVFVNEHVETILRTVEEYHLTAIQLHGNETPKTLKTLRSTAPKPLLIIKAFPIASVEDVQATAAYADVCDYFLFDTKTSAYGGAGQSFDWDILTAYEGHTPFLLSGGISVDSLPALRAFRHPQLAGYDLNSRFETSPAVKSPQLLMQFINSL